MSRKKLQKSKKKLSILGKRIKRCLDTNNFRQNKFAEILDVSEAYISKLMNKEVEGGIKFWDAVRKHFPEWEDYLRGYANQVPKIDSKEKSKKVSSERNPTYPLVEEQRDPLDQCFEMLREIHRLDRKIFFTIKASLEGVVNAWKLKEQKDAKMVVDRRHGERRTLTQGVELERRRSDRRRVKETPVEI